MNDTEFVAAYIGVLRHELSLPPGTDALGSLEERLFPAERSERPIASAPGIQRLKRALKRLKSGKPPAQTLDQFADDLQFLMTFDGSGSWPDPVLNAIFADLELRKRRKETPLPDNVVPFERRRARRKGDAP